MVPGSWSSGLLSFLSGCARPLFDRQDPDQGSPSSSNQHEIHTPPRRVDPLDHPQTRATKPRTTTAPKHRLGDAISEWISLARLPAMDGLLD